MLYVHMYRANDKIFFGTPCVTKTCYYLASSRLSFISIHDQVLGSAITGLVHEGPLHTGGESGSTSTSQSRSLDLIDDPVSALLHDLLGLVPLTPGHGPLEPPVVTAIDVGEDPVLVSQGAVLGLGGGISRLESDLGHLSAGTHSGT